MSDQELRAGAVTHRKYIVALIFHAETIRNRMSPDSPNIQRMAETLRWLNDYIAAIDTFIAGGPAEDLLKIQESLIDRIRFMKELVMTGT